MSEVIKCKTKIENQPWKSWKNEIGEEYYLGLSQDTPIFVHFTLITHTQKEEEEEQVEKFVTRQTII